MLKTLKTLVLLTTISCGYTSSLNTQSNLDLNNQNLNSILNNNNLDNITINEFDSNNKTSNTNKFLGKKRLSKKFVKKKKTNNAYKYLFNDENNEYFTFENYHAETSNPEYKQLMENLHDTFINCLHILCSNLYINEDENTEYLTLLTEIRVDIGEVQSIAKIFDGFKFQDEKKYTLANNNISNLNKYITEKYKLHNTHANNILISFHDFYVYYVYNQVNKLYYQTANALKKSISNNDRTNKQIEIVSEFIRVLGNVTETISGNILNQEYYVPVAGERFFAKISNCYQLKFGDSKLESIEKYKHVLDWINNKVEDCGNYILLEKQREFSCIKKGFREQFNDMHANGIKYYLDELINNISDYQNIKIDTTNNEELKNDNKEYFDDLLDRLNIENDIKVLNCKDFLINGRNDITIQQYLNEFASNFDILQSITDKKIQYQIEHEHTITFAKSVRCYENIIKNVFNNIKEQCKENDQLHSKLYDLLINIDYETHILRCDDYSDSESVSTKEYSDGNNSFNN